MTGPGVFTPARSWASAVAGECGTSVYRKTYALMRAPARPLPGLYGSLDTSNTPLLKRGRRVDYSMVPSHTVYLGTR